VFFSILVHIVGSSELQLSEQVVKGAFLQFQEFHREPRTNFLTLKNNLHLDLLSVFFEDVAMMAEEYEISLVVERHHSATPILRILRE